MDENPQSVRDVEESLLVIYGNLFSMKNSKEIRRAWGKNKRFIGSNDNVLKQKDDLKIQLSDYRNKKKWKAMVQGLTYPYLVTFKFFRKTKGRFDYVNIVQILLDAMKDKDYFMKDGKSDDDMKSVIPIFIPYSIDTQNPRTIIHVIRDTETYLAMLRFLTEHHGKS